MIITVLSVVAQSESEQKSNSIKWAYRKRFAKGVGIHPNWALYGYATDDKGEWIIIIFHLILLMDAKPWLN